MDRLGPDPQRLLKLAAVLGRNVDRDTLNGMAQPEIADVAGAFDACVQSGLLEVIDDVRCRFHHALIAETAYDLLLRPEQQALNQRAAEVMEARGAGADASMSGRLAYHWDKAGDANRAVDYYDRALEQASAQHANTEVLRLGERALALATGAVSAERRATWHQAMQVAYRSQGHFTGTDDHLNAIKMIYDRPVPKGAVRCLAATFAEFFRIKTGRRLKGPSREALLKASAAHLASAEVAFDRQDTLQVLYNTLRGSNLAFSAGGDAVEIATAHAQMAMTAIYVPFALDGDTFANRAKEMLPRLMDEGAKSWIYVVLFAYEQARGRFEASSLLADEAMALATRAREPKHWEYAASGKANTLRLQARFAECDDLDARVYDSGHDRAVPQVKLWGTVGRLKNLWITNQFDLFEDWLDRSQSLLSDDLNKLNSAASNTIGHHVFSALNAVRQGRRADAVDDLLETKRLFEGLRDPQPYMVDPLSYIMDAVRGMRHAGGFDDLVRDMTDFVRKSARNTRRLYPMAWARVHLAQGDWHEARGQMDKATAAWIKATDSNGPVDLAFDNAMAHYRLAEFSTLSGDERAEHARQVDTILGCLQVELPLSWQL